MSVLSNLTNALNRAANAVAEKNHRAAILNRIRTVIRCENAAAEREYLALGRYYYNHLRDGGNAVAEAHCASIDEVEARIAKAQAQLEQVYAGAEPTESCCCDSTEEGACGCGCGCAEASEEEVEETTLDDIDTFDEDPDPDTLDEVPKEPEEDVNSELPFEG